MIHFKRFAFGWMCILGLWAVLVGLSLLSQFIFERLAVRLGMPADEGGILFILFLLICAFSGLAYVLGRDKFRT